MNKLLTRIILVPISIVIAYFVTVAGFLVVYLITNTIDGLQRGHTSPVHYLIPFYELGDVLIPFTNPRIIIETIPYLFKSYNLLFTILGIFVSFLIYRILAKRSIK
jgi:hypothetical protein